MEGKDVKRRLVQSTLFPSKGSLIKESENCDAEEEVEEEELCSSSKSRRRIANSKSKTTVRASSKKVIESGKEISNKQVDDSDSSVPDKSNFFVKASERLQEKRQENQLVIIDSLEADDEICSPPSAVANCRSTPRKQKQQNSTPRKERKNSTPNKKMKNGRKELQCGQILFDLTVDEQPLRTIPDLRLEAKLTAEENSRIFAGRQIHPFFTSWKGGKINQDLIDSESKCSSVERKESGISLNPIHVFEHVEDNQTTLDWGQWIFSERSAVDDIDCRYSPVYEGSVDSLNFDNFMNGSHFTRASLYKSCRQCSPPPKGAFDELPYKLECSHPFSSSTLANKGVVCSEQQKDPDMLKKHTEQLQDNKIGTNDPSVGISCSGSFNFELQEKLLQERIISHYKACYKQTENCLWTEKYQPQNAKQICGNSESVKFLSEWLHLWHKRDTLTSRSCMDEVNLIVKEIDNDYRQSDSDCDTNDEESLKNVLLITGPVGSGKSAAIYTCARDQGFQVIEINASDWRNGALVKQKFGEAVESHWLQRTVETGTNSDSKSVSKFFKAVKEERRCSDNEVVELIHVSDKEDPQEACPCPELSVYGESRTANYQNGIKTLILFEDVDATLYEDHGFITTIQHLAETAKRPMILTSNSDNPVLPKNLDRSELRFSVPSREELFELVHMICVSEKAKIHPYLIERFVDCCQQDIRKTIMLLQFWFQGQALGEGDELHTMQWRALFDLDAGHHILPKVIHWGCPSKLSDLVAEEIVKSLTLEEAYGLMVTNRGANQNDYDVADVHMQDAEPDSLEVKKKAMLSLQSSLHDEVECAQFEANHELFDFSCSPVAFARKKSRRKFNTVLSDSEDDFSDGSIPLVSDGVNINVEVLNMKNMPISDCLCTEIHDHPIRPANHFDVDKLEDHCRLGEGVDYSQMEDTCKSQDVSLVPESSFVPETEIIDEKELYSTTVSYGHFLNEVGANCVIQDQDSIPILGPGLGAYSRKSYNDQETIGANSETSAARVCQEEFGDSLSKSEADVPWGYHLLDECSRVDFVRGLKSLDHPEDDQGTDLVKATWKRLYDQCNDLRVYVTAEEKTYCQFLKLVHGMSNLITEADLLLKDCQTLVCDSLGSSMIPSENIHSFCYYDNQLVMSLIIAQHGMCLYAKNIASLGSIIGSTNTLDLASEMLSSSASSVALGKLASQDQRKIAQSDAKTNKDLNLLTGKSDSCLCNILQTVVPTRSYLRAKGNAFHEYISTLTQISRFEAARLSECMDKTKQRRARVPRHYLSSGSLAMSSEEISLLGQYNSYQKVSSLVRP